MQYRKLGDSDLVVSQLALGSMTWGAQNSPAEACRQLDYAMAAGVNFIDTAELYPVGAKAETHGRTEKIIGDWLRRRGGRNGLVLSSKVVGASSHLPWIRDGAARLDRRNIIAAVEGSLRRLKTDYLDLYQPHWPDRDSNRFGQLNYYHAPEKDNTPIAETLAALDSLIQAGKIRYAGVSNETPWGLAEYLRQSRENRLARIISIQNPYNLLNRSFEIGLSEFSLREHISLLAYSPAAGGLLSGKYLRHNCPAGSRLSLYREYRRFRNSRARLAVARYVDLARRHALDPVQMALAFVSSRPFTTSTIIGATSLDQLKNSLASVNIALDRAVLKGIEKVHIRYPNPCP